MKYLVLILSGILLVSCSGYRSEFICKERDTISGKCTKGEYVCWAPMVLKNSAHFTPRCYMENK